MKVYQKMEMFDDCGQDKTGISFFNESSYICMPIAEPKDILATPNEHFLSRIATDYDVHLMKGNFFFYSLRNFSQLFLHLLEGGLKLRYRIF